MFATRASDAAASLRITPVIFVLTLFLSASLLFLVQPLFTRVALPHMGGAPAVWTTAILFFQTVLIAGCLYAHLLTRVLPVRGQVLMHLGVWAAALLSLPLAVPEGWQLDPQGAVAWQTLLLFAAGIGLPVFALAANVPLVRFWHSRSGGLSAHDPGFLYGASALGSLVALLGFPLVAEPLFGASRIGLAWAAGFVALGGVLALGGRLGHGPAAAARPAPGDKAAHPTAWQVVHWLFLGFIPASLMLAVTLMISLDMGTFPLVWAVPLVLYLLSFVLAFSNCRIFTDRALKVIAALALAVLGLYIFGLHGTSPDWASVGTLLFCFFCIALYAHRRLYAARPARQGLTGFYLAMSVGGALGGLFNAVIAPAVFPGLQEAAITAVLAAILFIPFAGGTRRSVLNLANGVQIGMIVSVPALLTGFRSDGNGWTAVLMILCLGGILSMAWLRRNALGCYGAAVVLLLVGTLFYPDAALLRDRSFFGTHVVTEKAGLRIYGNGTTVHGAQRLVDDRAPRPEPLSPHHRSGPLAQVLTSERGKAARSIGVVGLGVGSLACYSRPGQDWHFYEIDPLVDRIARNPAYFRFLSACAPDAPTHMGDPRMVLSRQNDIRFDILVIDTHSSGTVPVHLITNEAMQLYLDRLNPGGLLVYHISDRYFDTGIPLARSAADLGLAARLADDGGHTKQDPADPGATAVLLARSARDFGALGDDPRWQPMQSDGGRPWTDDYANPISIMTR